MIGSLTGALMHQTEQFIILETKSGVGFKVFTGLLEMEKNQEIRLWTYHHVREDASDLYGFRDPGDLTTFEILMTVSGVGPKMALTIVSRLGRQTISDAIVNNQPAVFRSVSGVGQKVAEKIILELKTKIAGLAQPSLAGEESSEIFEALHGLGYHQTEILNALKQIDTALPTAEKIKQALRLLAQ